MKIIAENLEEDALLDTVLHIVSELGVIELQGYKHQGAVNNTTKPSDKNKTVSLKISRIKKLELMFSKKYLKDHSNHNEDETDKDAMVERIQTMELSNRYSFLFHLWNKCCHYIDCYGNRNPRYPQDFDVKSHIHYIKILWISLPYNEKPDWLSWSQILRLEKQMKLINTEI